MTGLVKYESARFALQQAVEIDEVKDIRDKAQAMAAYARQANDTKLVEWATEIKVRAERKAGQMLAEMPKNPGNLKNSSRSHDVTTTKLEDFGITKNQSSRWQKLASVSEEQFEQAVSAAKEVAGEVTTAAMLRIEKENRQKETPQKQYQEEQSSEDGLSDEDSVRAEMEAEFDPSAELESALIQIDEMNKEIGNLNKEIKLLNNFIDSSSDEQLCAANSEIKKLKALIEVIESQKRGFQSSENAAKQAAKMWKNKFEKLYKQMKAYGLVDF